jgi:hypothetical protein
MESNQAVSPANELLIGRLIAQFRTLDDAELTLSPDNFRMTQVVSGHEVSRDVDTGVAVAHPANVLRSLASLPDVVSGRVVAGKPAKLRVLKRLE